MTVNAFALTRGAARADPQRAFNNGATHHYQVGAARVAVRRSRCRNGDPRRVRPPAHYKADVSKWARPSPTAEFEWNPKGAASCAKPSSDRLTLADSRTGRFTRLMVRHCSTAAPSNSVRWSGVEARTIANGVKIIPFARRGRAGKIATSLRTPTRTSSSSARSIYCEWPGGQAWHITSR